MTAIWPWLRCAVITDETIPTIATSIDIAYVMRHPRFVVAHAVTNNGTHRLVLRGLPRALAGTFDEVMVEAAYFLRQLDGGGQ